MSWFQINHETLYQYSEPVRFAEHRLVLRPREGHDIRVEEMRLTISPEFSIEWSRDVFGNSVATVHLLEKADELLIRSECVIHQTADFPVEERPHAAPLPYPVIYDDRESIVASAYRTTTFPDDLKTVRSWVKNIDLPPEATADAVVDTINRAIRTGIRYNRRDERGVQSPSETLSLGTGSCRDLSTLLLEALRVLGFPARFASGYLDCRASEAGRASTHAWAEAYLPEIGWLGVDPTIGERTSTRHVVVGVSNHPRGVMPIKGSFYGKREKYLGMTVAVQTERLQEPPLMVGDLE
ncbi:MAG: transglutaminase family protein [Chthoniobacterales bacterium]